MNGPGNKTNRSLDATKLCQQFRAQWERHGPMPLEVWLVNQSIDPLEASDLIRLVKVEVDLRRERGLAVETDDFAARFPQLDRQLVSDLLTMPAPPPAPPDTRPLVPPRYRVINRVGLGGMGEVWRVEDRQLRRMLAIKTLNERNRLRRSAHARLQREAMLLGGLTHPGIPPVHERGELLNGIPYFAMKLVEGRTLADLMKERKDSHDRLGYFLGVFERIANTMAFAHRQAVIHRDLKPQNVMVGRFGEVQIMDWGMARRLSEDGSIKLPNGDDMPSAQTTGERETTPDRISERGLGSSLRVAETMSGAADPSRVDPLRTMTRDGDVIGTPAYMSPEQARGEVRSLAATADVFSLGAVLYEILTGQTPTAQVPTDRLLETIRSNDISIDVGLLNAAGVDGALADLCTDCLQPNAADRTSDAGQVAERIAGYLEAAEERVHNAELEARAATVIAREERKRRRLAWILMATIVFALVVGGLGWWWVRNGQLRMAEQRARDRAEQAVMSIGGTSLAGLPYAIENLKPLGGHVTAPLDRAFDAEVDVDRKMRFAIAKASLGDVRTEFLARQIGRVTLDGLPLLVESIRAAGDEGVRAVVKRGELETDPAIRMRYWLVAANLGDTEPLVNSLHYVREVPSRLALLELCESWWGDLTVLVDLAEVVDKPMVGFAALSAVAEIDPDRISQSERDSLAPTLEMLATDDHPAVRAAAELVLRRWEMPIPELTAEMYPLDGTRSWGSNSVGMLMIRINQAFDDGDGERVPRGGYAWYVSDREVTEDQFRQFLKEDQETADRVGEFEAGSYKGMTYRDYFANAHPQRLEEKGTNRAYPISSIGYYDALRFCNWLSRREGFQPVYENQSDHKTRNTFGKRYRDEVWVKNPLADGYRLPEWNEFQHMALGHSHFRSATTFFAGDSRFWRRFGWCLKNTDELQPVATRLPNRFGLFDTSGNVAEFGDFVRYDEGNTVAWHTLGESFQSPDLRPGNTTRGRPLPSIIFAPADGFRVVRCPAAEIAKRETSKLGAAYATLKVQIERAESDMEVYAANVTATDLAFKYMEKFDFPRAIEIYRRSIDLSNELIDREFQTARAKLERGGNHVNVAIALNGMMRLDEAEAMIEAAGPDLKEVAAGNSQYRKAAEIYLNNRRRALAKIWLSRAAYLACSTFEGHRDGERASDLARQAIEVLGRDDAEVLAVLAAAHAEVGDFEQAIAVQEESLALLREREIPGDNLRRVHKHQMLLDQHEARLRYYQDHRPWHDPRITAPR